ncbi:hypothetical protein ACFFQW_21060 [Umezawaea endophytica]|uniref:Uncharacterized protein n=1 Tax=Umezawaea endophytica TaxID=1654476 RepID=A0A9X2VQP9_9PSEU|nr:hypothetical protein [Umezawaea endophytica]MCS7480564.1 hypothetical protein [Umezawaea endophytica]
MSVEFGVGVETSGPRAVKPSSAGRTAALAIPVDTAAPDSAGGLGRNRATEGMIPDLLEQVRGQLPGTIVVPGSTTFAVYHLPDVSAPNGDVLLVRGSTTDATQMLEVARARPRQQGAPTEVDLGNGVRGVCTQSPNSGGFLVPACAWVTVDAFGQIAPLVPLASPEPPLSTAELADVMRGMLADLP